MSSTSPAETRSPIGCSLSVLSTTSPAAHPLVARDGGLAGVAVRVEDQQERRVVQLLALRPGRPQRVAGDEHPERVQPVVEPVGLGHLPALGVDPGQVLRAALDGRPALEEVPLPQRRVLAPQPQGGLRDVVQVEPGVVGAPVQPGHLVVLHVGVVVAALGAPALVAGGDHRDPGGQAQRGQQVRGLLVPQRDDVGVGGLALDAAVPGAVVVGAVAVLLEVGLVVLAVVADQVAQREAVVGGHEVHRGVRRPAVVGVQVGGARQPGGDVADPAGVEPPEVPDGVAVLVVPLAPRRREPADLVAVHARVPRLGDQLHVPQHRVLADRGDEVPVQVDPVAGPGERRGQVEAEAVDVHLGDPVAQRVQDHPQRRRVRGVQLITLVFSLLRPAGRCPD